jgi:hypothetical protein
MSTLYVLIILVAALASAAFSLRKNGVFNCKAFGYGGNNYLAYCGGNNYGDYDYGAFWFGLEPEAVIAAQQAQVLFLGNSRLQFGFSTNAVDHWFSDHSVRHYLFGFAYDGNYKFADPLIRRMRPGAAVYVINLDLFFEESDTPPARAVLRDRTAEVRYEQKRQWQRIHEPFCQFAAVVCGNGRAFFRSRHTGAWIRAGGGDGSYPVSYEDEIREDTLTAYVARGEKFLSDLRVPRECVILTMVPTVNTNAGTARAIAEGLGQNLIAPHSEDLNTFDHSHLDPESAERWSTAFLSIAGPRILKCLNGST